MYDEYNALIKNDTWILVLKPPNVNVVRSMWLFRHKYHADGSLSRYKARLVANGCNQQYGVDCSDTFSPVVKSATIRTVLSLELAQNWHVHQLDVKNTFLNGNLTETVYMYQPPGFVDSRFHIMYADYSALLQRIISSLHKEFDMTDLGALNYFLRISVTRDTRGMFLSQKKYAMDLLERAHMSNGNATRTSVDTKSKLGSDGDPIFDSTLYRSLAGGLHAEAEYRGVANVVAEITWIRNMLRELHTPLFTATLVYCDNVSAVYMSTNPIQHQRTKHIEIDIYFVHDMVARGQVRVLHVPSRY
nr:hypothetical protein [Tanacetum cinerariifolium]